MADPQTSLIDALADVRKDVESVIELFEKHRDPEEREGLRSAAGQMVIHDSRVPRKRKVSESTDDSAQGHDDRRIAELRRLIYARPADPRFELQPSADGTWMHRVAPLLAVVQIVRMKTRRKFTPPREMRSLALWLQTIDSKIGRLDGDEVYVLRGAALLAIRAKKRKAELEHLEDVLASSAERMRMGPATVAALRARRVVLTRYVKTLSRRRRSIVHRQAYANAVTMFAIVCAPDQKTLAYCLRWNLN